MPELKRVYKTGGSTVVSLSPGAMAHMGVSCGDYVQIVIMPGGIIQIIPVTRTTVMPGYGPADVTAASKGERS